MYAVEAPPPQLHGYTGVQKVGPEFSVKSSGRGRGMRDGARQAWKNRLEQSYSPPQRHAPRWGSDGRQTKLLESHLGIRCELGWISLRLQYGGKARVCAKVDRMMMSAVRVILPTVKLPSIVAARPAPFGSGAVTWRYLLPFAEVAWIFRTPPPKICWNS